MTGLSKSLFWRRLDTTGAEHCVVDDQSGLAAHGTFVAAAPVPYTCTYELLTDEHWASVRLAVSTEGAGFLRRVKVERTNGRWRVTATEQGDLDKALTSAGRARDGLPGAASPDELAEALDIDLGHCPLTNTLPVRRLNLLNAPIGEEFTITAAWVLVPSLMVVASKQRYTNLGSGRVRYASGTFSAELTLDSAGYVLTYPGLAARYPE